MKKKAAHDTFKQFNQKKTPAVVRGATNSLKVGCRNAKKTNKLDTYQQLEHEHNRLFHRQLIYKT